MTQSLGFLPFPTIASHSRAEHHLAGQRRHRALHVARPTTATRICRDDGTRYCSADNHRIRRLQPVFVADLANDRRTRPASSLSPLSALLRHGAPLTGMNLPSSRDGGVLRDGACPLEYS